MNEFTSPAVQAMNLIRYIGDEVSKSGEPLGQLPGISEQIGAPSKQFFEELVEELYERGLIRMMDPITNSGGPLFLDVTLSLEGWEQYEAEKRGELRGNTHDNNGAYWEAGFAEGLGKPVIYICKKEKFEDQKTHFDTNHCTTVPWSRDEDEGFRQELTATLRRSLDLSS